jgi:hypothetical protein
MKVMIKCLSPLLQKTLEIYLQKYIYDIELADVLITDTKVLSEKVVFLVGTEEDADLKIPFTKEELYDALEHFYKTNPRLLHILHTKETLESMIEKLNKKHHEKITRLIKSYHEKA